jgi:hypothetical protein
MRQITAGGVKRALAVVVLGMALVAAFALFCTTAGAQVPPRTVGQGAFGPILPIPTTLWQLAPGLVPASGNYVYLESDPGDYIGQGQAYLYVPATAVLTVAQKSNANGPCLDVRVNGDKWWFGDFQAMNTLTDLEPGFYPNLLRFPGNPTQGGLDWEGDGRGSNTLTGWFVVDSVTYANDALTGVALRFELHSEGGTPALHGAIRWQAGDAAPQTATTVSLSAPSVSRYGAALLRGSLMSVATNGLADEPVTIRYWAGAWKTLGTVTTNAAGAWAVAIAPTTNTTYEAVFAGDAANAGSTSATATVLPRVYLSRPAAPKATRTTTRFTCSCLLRPRHAAGKFPVVFVCQRHTSGQWVNMLAFRARAANYSSYTRCTARMRLTMRGSWRICAVHLADALNAETISSWRSVKVR